MHEGDLAGRRVLEVGCGTGRLAALLAGRGARVFAVDSSPAMLEVARATVPRGVGLKLAEAEALPFKDGWFERAVMRLVVHLLDRSRALPELRRVLAPGGRLAIATFDPAHFERFWLRRVFPALEAIDRARFPAPAALAEELRAAGFGAVRAVPLSQRALLPREEALRRVRGRFISTLELLDERDFAAGLERAERELPDPVEVVLEWSVTVADVT